MHKADLKKLKELDASLKERNMTIRCYDSYVIFFQKKSSHRHHYLQFHLGQTHMNCEPSEIREVVGRTVETKDKNSFWFDEKGKLRQY